MTALVLRNKVPGFYDFYNCANHNRQAVTIKNNNPEFQITNLENPVFNTIVLIEQPIPHQTNLSNLKPKGDLPLMSEFGEINNPYELIFANLENLQYYTKHT